jgi:hypothetical protein
MYTHTHTHTHIYIYLYNKPLKLFVVKQDRHCTYVYNIIMRGFGATIVVVK